MIAGIDLFCGAGGLTRGLREAGVAVLRGYDTDNECRTAYTANNPGSEFVCRSVREIDPAGLAAFVRSKAPRAIVLAACAPCQPFSQAANTARLDARRALLTPVATIARAVRPDVVLVENVPGILKVGGYSAFRRLVRSLCDDGYCVEFGVLDAKSYGVPQTRRRLVLLAGRGFSIPLPPPTHGKPPLAPFRTVWESIGHYPPVTAGEAHPSVANHVACALRPINLARIQATPPDGGGRVDWPDDLYLDCHRRNSGHEDVYGRMAWRSPAPTLTAKCNSISNGRYGHPEQDRAITIREAATLQGFPDDYEFHGSLKAMARQVGNAVPPLLAEHLARAALEALATGGGMPSG